MSVAQLAHMAAYINLSVRWRFSWYWQTTKDRLKRLEVPEFKRTVTFPVREVLPTMTAPIPADIRLHFKRATLGSIFRIIPGHYHNVGNLPTGTVPVISCGDLENGVCGYFDVQEHVYNHKLTIAFNGATLSAKYHPYMFAAKDDVAVCSPREPLKLTTLLFIQVMLGRERWRFSYYRKCFKSKLERVAVTLPMKRGGIIDEAAIEEIIQATPYWKYLQERLHDRTSVAPVI